MHRLKTRPQFQAAMAGGTVSRTAHFALHRLVLTGDALEAATQKTEPGELRESQNPQALFGVPGIWLGAMAPKRWARRAVTRNAIKRQVYNVAASFEERLPRAAYVVRLRTTFDRKIFLSASSDVLKAAVRQELQQLFTHASRKSAAAEAVSTRP